MNRRDFVKTSVAVGGIFRFKPPSGIDCLVPDKTYDFRTRHVIWLVNGNGSRKKDWYQDPYLSPNYARIANEGFVYEESYNETVSRHEHSWIELTTGNRYRPGRPADPTPLDYVREAYGDRITNYWLIEDARPHFKYAELTAAERVLIEDFMAAMSRMQLGDFDLQNAPLPRQPFIGDAIGLAMIPALMKAFKPRMLIYHQVGHDAAHGNGGYPRCESGYSEYQRVCRTTDEQIGRLFDFISSDPYFSKNTTIVIRPEFGRDDEMTRYGELHHSTGYYQSHHSAEIWWGPDIKTGVDKTLKSRLDLVPTLTKLFNVDALAALGQIHPEMFKESLGSFPAYRSWTRA